MTSTITSPLVLILGITGNTGQVIVNALLKSDTFRIAGIVRPASVSKPLVEQLRAQGVDIRVADFTTDSPDDLQKVLSGVDIFISTVTAEAIPQQKPILAAAKAVGVKRIIPCDFGTAGPRGIRALHDDKLDIRDYVRNLGVGYTFIDVGWWMQVALPYSSAKTGVIAEFSHEVIASGKNALTNLNDIGTYVARIIADPRTLNQYVFVWQDAKTREEAMEIGERVSREGQKLKDLRKYISAEEILSRAKAAKARYAQTHLPADHIVWTWYEYQYSMHVRGDNTVENAKAMGALDAQELYPDIPLAKLEEVAKSIYGHSESSFY